MTDIKFRKANFGVLYFTCRTNTRYFYDSCRKIITEKDAYKVNEIYSISASSNFFPLKEVFDAAAKAFPVMIFLQES